jgi:hypothetical protein
MVRDLLALIAATATGNEAEQRLYDKHAIIYLAFTFEGFKSKLLVDSDGFGSGSYTIGN